MKIKEKFEKIKPHIPFVIAIFLVELVVFFNFFSLYELPADDHITYYTPNFQTLKQSVEKFNDFTPLWNPYKFSGMPDFSKGNFLWLDSLAFLVLFFSPVVALKLNYILDVFLAGLFMYILMVYLIKKPKFAFISSLVYMLNGYMMMMFRDGWLTSMNAYAFMPLILLFMVKIFKSKDWIKYSVILAILFAIQMRVGPDLKVFLWTGLMFFVYLAVHIVGKNFLNRLLKAFFVGVIVLVVLFGLGAQRIMPTKESVDASSRGHLSWEESASRKLSASKFFITVIEPVYKGMPQIRRDGGGLHIGIAAFLLAGFAVYRRWKSRMVLFLSGSALLSILISMGTFVFYLLWKYVPPFDSTRYINRALILFIFTATVLAGIGAVELFSVLEKKLKRKGLIFAYGCLVALVLLNLYVFNYDPTNWKLSDANKAIEHNYILQNISSMPGIFRINTYETRGIDWGTDFYNIPFGLEHIYAYEAVWDVPYMNVYLGTSYRDPAKFWGILNVKYLTATEEVNISGFKFVKKFEMCDACWPEQKNFVKAYGPYLYENELFLPRAYAVDNSILVVGEENAVTQMIYGLMLEDNFNPSNTVVIRGKKSVNDYQANELRKFNAIALTTGSVDQASFYNLKNYADNGGILLPNVINNENSITNERIQEMWDSFKGGLNAVEDRNVIMHNFDKREIKINGQHAKKFLAYSEKFSVFPGWTAKADGKNIEIYNADSMISAVYLDGSYNNITFEYMPSSYRNGSIITIITILVVIGYFVYRVVYRKAKQKK